VIPSTKAHYEKPPALVSDLVPLVRQFMQSKTQQMHSRAAAAAIAFKSSRSDSMKANLLLTDEAEITRLMLKDVAFDELAMRDSEAHAGCNCDRWGHPCPGCVNRRVPTAESRVSSPVNQ
jgi:hypothetical protein